MPRILIEGWRLSPASYAVVNQYQILETLKRPGWEVYFRDVPFFTPLWKHTRGLWPAEVEEKIATLPAPPPDAALDASFRMAHPTVVEKTGARHSWCWIVTEFGILEQSRIGDKRLVAQALRTPGVRLMTPSNWAKAGLVRSGADPDNITIVPHGFDPATLKPAEPDERERLRAALGWKDRFVFLNVGTLVWNKGVSTLLQAFAMVVQKRPEAILVLKGNDQMLQSDRRLHEAWAKLPPELARAAQNGIRYLGQQLTFGQIADLYRAADCYVAPYHAEGFNMPAMEAAACGLPLIVTGGGPTDDFTTADFCRRIDSQPVSAPELQAAHGLGAMVLQVDGEHLVSLMSAMIDDRAFHARARHAGPAHMNAHYTWEKVTDQYLRALVPD